MPYLTKGVEGLFLRAPQTLQITNNSALPLSPFFLTMEATATLTRWPFTRGVMRRESTNSISLTTSLTRTAIFWREICRLADSWIVVACLLRMYSSAWRKKLLPARAAMRRAGSVTGEWGV